MTTINIDKTRNANYSKYIEDKQKDDYTNFYNKEEYKISLINIDSIFRNRNPKNIFSSNVSYLPVNPLTFTEDSQEILINYPNHNLSLNDRIIIQNVEGESFIISANLFLFQNFEYLIIKTNHNINPKYNNLVNKLKLEISIVDETTMDNLKLYGNIPINSILGINNIELPSVVLFESSTTDIILEYFNKNTFEELDEICLLIKLPFPYFSSENQILEITDFFKLTFYDINGIPVNGINSDFPINYQRLQGFQQVSSIVDSNHFYIQTNYIAISNGSGGGNKIQIMKILQSEAGYPDANNYNVRLKKTFNNVIRIELISSEMPYIDYLVKSSGIYKNNKLYWKHLDDGNHVYSIEIPEGNYDGESLINILSERMNSLERISSTLDNKILNLFTIDYNKYTQEIKFSAFKTENVPNSLRIDLVEINNLTYYRLTIFQPNNLVQVGDLITISNAEKMGIVNTSYINKEHTVYEINKINNSYTILLATTIQIPLTSGLDTTLTDNGGGNIILKTAARVSFLFNYSDTIGNLLGFKNPGQINSITPYNSIISNFNPYSNDTNLNSVGIVNNNSRLLNFTGSYNYYLLYINDYELIQNNSNQQPAFAKILLSGNPGDILYNTFVNFPLEFDIPISSLNELSIKITYPDGTLPDFRNIEHSFTLRITELISYSKNTGLNSRKTNFIETLKNF